MSTGIPPFSRVAQTSRLNRPFSTTIAVAAGSQFLGTEFSVQSPNRPTTDLRKVVEIALHMGGELKTWRIVKVRAGVQYLLRQSTDAQGNPAANTVTDVVLNSDQAGGYLEPGEQIQVVTTGAAGAMTCTQRFEVVP